MQKEINEVIVKLKISNIEYRIVCPSVLNYFTEMFYIRIRVERISMKLTNIGVVPCTWVLNSLLTGNVALQFLSITSF